MIHVLIEDHSSIDSGDMENLLQILSEEGFEAARTQQETVFKGSWWVLTIHWMADDTSHLAFDAAMTAIAVKVHKHFRHKGKTAPKRLDIKDRDGNLIGSVEIENSSLEKLNTDD
jgi:hypothetical protein